MTRALDRWRRVALGVALFALVWPAAALAQSSEDDSDHYDPSSPAWNGLTAFRTMASSAGFELKTSDSIDYGELEADQRLIVVYPKTDVDVGSLADFVVAGGRILWVDDFGRSDAFLERLDIDRSTPSPAGLPHDRFANDRRGLPVFHPEGVHPLLKGVSTLIANHPAVLTHRGGPVVPYQQRGGLVYDMNLGKGKIVVVADASLLINQMLRVADNRRFAHNALEYLCEGVRASCAPRMLIGRFSQSGRYGEDDAGGSSMEQLLESFNETLARLQKRIPSSPLLYYLAMLLAGGMVFYLVTVFSLRRPQFYSDYVGDTLEDVPSPQSEFEWNLSRFDANRRETNFALPLSILKEIFEELVLRDLDMWRPESDDRPSVVQIAARFSERYLDDLPSQRRRKLEAEFKDVLATFARIPTRHRVFLDSDTYFSDEDLIQLYERAMRVLDFMDLEEEYERRTRPFV